MHPQHSDGVLRAAATRTYMAIATVQQPAGGLVSDHFCSVPEGSAADSRGSPRQQQQRRPKLRQHDAGADHLPASLLLGDSARMHPSTQHCTTDHWYCVDGDWSYPHHVGAIHVQKG